MSNSSLNVIQGSGQILGTPLDDCIIGSAGIDYIWAEDGDDEVEAGAGADVVKAGRGNDTVSGGEGNDEIDGQNGDDILFGDEGADEIAGGDGNDYLFGGSNLSDIDDLNGEDGHDVLVGGAGYDRLVGGDDSGSGDDDDYLVGTDYVAAGDGEIDYLRGGRGADTFVLGETKAALEQDDLRKDELTGQMVDQKAYYLDAGFGNGNAGYAVIEDFRPNDGDTIQLLNPDVLSGGSIFVQTQFYTVGPSPIPGVQGSAIYISSKYTFVPDDLIAIVRFAANPDRQVNLNSRYMSYVGEAKPLELPMPPFAPLDPFPIEPYPIDLPAGG
ncbi:MAG: calcium-binding protein [Leptolyngbyaceae bacterium]|nr:calcium-binding protein [Leptolyngbyaceae bacterium]